MAEDVDNPISWGRIMNLHKLSTGTENILETEKITEWLRIGEET
jgi:hypothetical protein